MRPLPFLVFPFLLGLTLISSGCRTTPAAEISDSDIIEPIGRVAYVYPREEIAIVRLNSGARVSADRLWIVENPAGRATAMLRSTDTRRGRTLGFVIDEGLPNPGDNVFRKLEE